MSAPERPKGGEHLKALTTEMEAEARRQSNLVRFHGVSAIVAIQSAMRFALTQANERSGEVERLDSYTAILTSWLVLSRKWALNSSSSEDERSDLIRRSRLLVEAALAPTEAGSGVPRRPDPDGDELDQIIAESGMGNPAPTPEGQGHERGEAEAIVDNWAKSAGWAFEEPLNLAGKLRWMRNEHCTERSYSDLVASGGIVPPDPNATEFERRVHELTVRDQFDFADPTKDPEPPIHEEPGAQGAGHLSWCPALADPEEACSCVWFGGRQ